MSAVPATITPDELALRLRQQELVAGFGTFALRKSTVEQLLDEACKVAAEGLATIFAKVLRSRAEETDLFIVAGFGWHAGVVGHSTIGAGLDSPAGYTLHTGTPTISNHLGIEQRFRVPAILAEHGVQSAINVVIQSGEEAAFGVLEVDSTRRHEFVQADTSFLQALAHVLAEGLRRYDSERAMEALLREKDVLVREVHHRVANSLQLVRTMLSLQSRNATDETREQLQKASGRISGIAAVHRHLYQGGSVLDGDASTYLAALVEDLKSVVPDGREVTLRATPVMLSADALTPVGLIVSELVINAAKYGQGTIAVTFDQIDEGVEIQVTDEGPGFGASAGDRAGWGLGMRMITSLLKGAAIEIDRDVSYGRVRTVFKP